MAEVCSRKQGGWESVSLAPDVCKTPMGGSTPPVPYSVVSPMPLADGTAATVNANGAQVEKHDATVMEKTSATSRAPPRAW